MPKRSMNAITGTNFLLIIVIAVCSAASLTDEDIAKIFDDTAREDSVANIGEYGNDLHLGNLRDKLRTLESLGVENGDLFPVQDPGMLGDAVSKRPFCNGFTGCGRLHGKRSSSASSSSILEKLQVSDSAPEVEPSIAKRPFCNGFFGCGNPGKRLVFRNLVNPKVYSVERSTQRKRFFCNPGAFGCTNRVKRSPLKSLFSSKKHELLS